MELAASMKTTSANISQQLRLLELGGLVKSEKTSNSDKGKPRVVYTLSSDSAYLILTMPGFAEKKMLTLSTYHKFMMRAWFLENTEHHQLAGEAYEILSDGLASIDLIAAQSSGSILSLYLVMKKGFTPKKIEIPKVRVNSVTIEELWKKSDLILLYGTNDKYNEVGR